jgi:hypothetical protein
VHQISTLDLCSHATLFGCQVNPMLRKQFFLYFLWPVLFWTALEYLLTAGQKTNKNAAAYGIM